MKYVYFFYLLIFSIHYTFGQNIDPIKYESKLKESLKHYDENVISTKLLEENVATAFSYLIFSSSDLTTNSSAFGYSQNEDKTNISINSNLRLGGEQSRYYLRIGANAIGSNSVFEFYSNNSWKSNAGFSIGLLRRTGKSFQYYTGNKEKELINKKRIIFAREIIYNNKKYSKENLDIISQLKQDILGLKVDSYKFFKENKNYAKLFKVLPEVEKFLQKSKYQEAYLLLDKEEEKIRKALCEVAIKQKPEKYIEKEIFYEFDKENDIAYGYNIMWFDFNLNLSNSTYKFNKDLVDSNILKEVDSLGYLKNGLNNLKSSISLSYNRTKNSKKIVWFYQFGVNLNYGSFLDNGLINGNPKIYKDVNDIYIIKDEDEKTVGFYDEIKKKFGVGAFNAYGAIFFTKKKDFGLNISAQHEYLIKKTKNAYYKNNFTLLFGPIFRKVKDNETKLSFGVDVGWENGIYGSKVTKDFTGRIRVGIPFNIYAKKKKK